MNEHVTYILICPWWEMHRTLHVGDFEFMSVAVAIERYPELARSLESSAKRYCTGYQYPAQEDMDAYQRGHDVPLRLERSKPTIAILRAGQILEDARAHVDMVMFACMSEMDLGFYVNATVFESRVFSDRGHYDGFVLEHSRRMTGGATNLYDVRSRIETRPLGCGQYYAPNEEMLDGLLAAFNGPNYGAIRQALTVFTLATRDAHQVPVETERSFYALVGTRLLSDVTANDNLPTHTDYLRQLLNSQVTGGAQHILDVYRSTRLNRNEQWHPNPRVEPLFAFEEQTIVPLNLVYFRAIEAILVARLVDLGCVATDSKLAAKVPAINAWIGDVNALKGQVIPTPTPGVGVEMVEAKERYDAARTIVPRWHEAWNKAIFARIAKGAKVI